MVGILCDYFFSNKFEIIFQFELIIALKKTECEKGGDRCTDMSQHAANTSLKESFTRI